jgi:hypothetical protein
MFLKQLASIFHFVPMEKNDILVVLSAWYAG